MSTTSQAPASTPLLPIGTDVRINPSVAPETSLPRSPPVGDCPQRDEISMTPAPVTPATNRVVLRKRDESIRSFGRKAACISFGRGLPSGHLHARSAGNCRRAPAPEESSNSQRFLQMNGQGTVVSRRPEVLFHHLQRRSHLALRMGGRAAASAWTLSPNKGFALMNALTKCALSATRTPWFGKTANV